MLPCCRCASTRTSTPLTAYLACVAPPCQSARQSCCPRLCFCFYSESSHRASSSSHLLPTYLSCIPYTRTHTHIQRTNDSPFAPTHPAQRSLSAVSPVACRRQSPAFAFHRPHPASAQRSRQHGAIGPPNHIASLSTRLSAPSTFDPFAFHYSWRSSSADCWPELLLLHHHLQTDAPATSLIPACPPITHPPATT